MKKTHITRSDVASRREFLKRSSALSVVGVAAPWALNLAAIGEASAQSANDYKAIVCVFLQGGNDNGNTLVPYDEASHAAYSTQRLSLTVPRDALAANVLSPATALPEGRRFALPTSMSPLKSLFDSGQMAALLNVGPIIQPTSKAQYTALSVPLPPKLFSHNDQQSVWQSSQPEGSTTGWGGRMGDLFAAGNGNATFTAISTSGNAVYLAGDQAVQYQVSGGGSIPINGIRVSLFGSTAAAQALRQVITQPAGAHLMNQAYATITQRSIDADVALRGALSAAPTLATTFPATPLGTQLRMVARTISARAALGAKRQVFFVSIGGFDAHDDLMTNQPALLSQVADAMSSFYHATVEMGVAQQVTSFTASEFGRTLVSNGDGSDHGWGSHHFVVGGAVRGQRFVGTAPDFTRNGPDDVGQGRLLPTTGVDQLAATLATWMGVGSGSLASVVPGIGNFTNRDLGLFV